MHKISKTILIIGASRGLGLGLVREYLKRHWKVIATARGVGAPAGHLAFVTVERSPLEEIAARNPTALQIENVDINEPGQVADLRRRLDGQSLDAVFVNAGVANDPGETAGVVATGEFNRIMVTNALSPMRVVEQFANVVDPRGVIAVMSSELGSVANNTSGGWEVYRASKAALNTLMRSYAARSGKTQTLLSIAPGWVRTDMGGSAAPLDVETSIRGVVDMIESRTGTPGLAFVNYKNEELPW